jgi:cytochrome c553
MFYTTRPNVALGARSLFAAAALLALTALPGLAQQNNAAAYAGAAVWGRGGCANCHGNFAAGDGDPSYPAGPSLRRTRLDRDALIETISCGRPGTQMPMNLKGAYDEVPCFGLGKGEVPGEVVGLGKGALTADEIATLVTFLVENVVGKTRITKANCALFFEGNANSPACQQFNN